MIFIFFGPPGAGKGTQAALVAKEFNIPHLSTGDILRSKLEENDQLSAKLKEIMDSGNLVSDNILNEIVEKRLNSTDCINGFILDGYPRTIIQKNFLSDYLRDKSLVISNFFDLKIDDDIIVNRIKSRSNIENRQDDREDVIKTRITKYFEETKPLSDYYSSKHAENYHFINGNQEIEMIYIDIMKIIKKWGFSVIN